VFGFPLLEPDGFGHVPPGPDDGVPPVPLDATPAAPTNNTARLHVLVPPDAQLWFEGKSTSKRGGLRDFYSPTLPPGKTFLYAVRARWREDGRWVEQQADFKVRANQTTVVRFPLPETDELPPPRPAPAGPPR